MSHTVACVNSAPCVSVDDFDYDLLFPNDNDEQSPAKGRVQRLKGLQCLYLVGETTEVDFVYAQRPTRDRTGKLQRPEYFPGKRFRTGETGRKEKLSYNVSGWFQSWCYAVDDIASLHQAFEQVRLCKDSNGEPGYVIAGELAPWASERSAPRSKKAAVKHGRSKPQGLIDAPRWWLVLDVDKVANLLGIDPRESLEARLRAIDYLRSFLPPELRFAACSWQLSSSCCVFGADGIPLPTGQAPARLGAHLRFWIDTGLDEAARKTLLLRIAQYVRAEMMSRGIDASDGAGVDAACATYNQAIFISASFEAGVSDPLPERSGMTTGTAEVLVGELEMQLPELAAKVRAPKAKLTEEEKAANRDRRTHDRLLRGARRTTSVAPGPRRDEVDPVPGVHLRRQSRSRGPQETVLQASRWGKLHDIVIITENRRGRVPIWENGIPVGMRRKAMLIVAGLLSHFVPAAEMPAAIDSYGEALTSRGWMDEEWHYLKRDEHIIRKAELAEAAERAGDVSNGLREDPWLARIMAMMQPTYEEMVRLRLRSLRTDGARKEVARRDAGKRTVEELRQHRATASEAATRPWEALAISESTYRRKKRMARQEAFAATKDMSKAKLTERGMGDLRAFLQLAVVPEHRASLELLADGPLAAIRHENLSPCLELHHHLADRAKASKSQTLADAALAIQELSEAWRTCESTVDIVRWILTGTPGYLGWAHEHDAGERFYAVSDIIASAEHHPRPAEFLRETPMTVLASVLHCNGEAGDGVGQTSLQYPGTALAGCSRATWYRRQAASRSAAVLHPSVQVTVPQTGMW
jgi:hypothetical protein